MLKCLLLVLFIVQSLISIIFEVDLFFGLNRVLLPIGLIIIYHHLFKKKFGPTHCIVVFIALISLQALYYAGPAFVLAMLLSNESGILIFFISGLLFAAHVSERLPALGQKRGGVLTLACALAIICVLNIFFAYSIINQDNFLYSIVRFASSKVDANYQVVGDLYLLLNIIFQILFILFYIGLPAFRPVGVWLIYGLQSVVTLVCCQIIGSNMATVMSVLLILLTVATLKSYEHRAILGASFSLKNSFLSIFGFCIIAPLIILPFVIIGLDGIGMLSAFRIFNFDEASLVSTSVTSRFQMLGTFAPLAKDYPIFGNMINDVISSQPGEYPHSLILSLFTHTGFVGLVLYISVSAWAMLNIISFAQGIEDERGYVYMYIIMLSIGCTLMGIAFTFWTWLLLWFNLGMMVYFPEFNE